MLHPFLIYDILKYAYVFDQDFLDDFYQLSQIHKLNSKKKKDPVNRYRTFLLFFLAFHEKNQKYLVQFIKSRYRSQP